MAAARRSAQARWRRVRGGFGGGGDLRFGDGLHGEAARFAGLAQLADGGGGSEVQGCYGLHPGDAGGCEPFGGGGLGCGGLVQRLGDGFDLAGEPLRVLDALEFVGPSVGQIVGFADAALVGERHRLAFGKRRFVRRRGWCAVGLRQDQSHASVALSARCKDGGRVRQGALA